MAPKSESTTLPAVAIVRDYIVHSYGILMKLRLGFLLSFLVAKHCLKTWVILHFSSFSWTSASPTKRSPLKDLTSTRKCLYSWKFTHYSEQCYY